MSEMTTYSAEDAQALPDGPHRVDWRIEPDWVGGAVTCLATGPARCRMVCAEGCGADGWPCGDDGVTGEHGLRDGGECNVVLRLYESGGPDQTYDGESEPLRSGLIDARWDGDCYLWTYADASPEVTK